MEKWVSGKMKYRTYSASIIDIPEKKTEKGEENSQGIIYENFLGMKPMNFQMNWKGPSGAYNG